jgi:hypothetical protein
VSKSTNDQLSDAEDRIVILEAALEKIIAHAEEWSEGQVLAQTTLATIEGLAHTAIADSDAVVA